MTETTDDYSDLISRRRFVSLTGAAGATALAGCGGNGGGGGSENGTGSGSDGGDESTGTDDGTAVVDQEFLAPQLNAPPTDGHYNAVSGHGNYHGYPSMLLYDPLLRYNYATGEFISYALSDYEITESDVTLTIRDGLTWHDGDAVTAQDLVTQFRLTKKLNGSLWDYAESVESVDDSTVRINLQKATNPTIIEFLLNGWPVAAKHSKYGRFLDQDAAALQEFDDTDPIGTGPFQFDEHGQQEMTFTRFDGHPDADNVNFSTYTHIFRDSNTSVHQGLLSLELDGGSNFFTPPAVVANMPDAVEEVRIPANQGYGIVVNFEHEHVGNRQFRQAIAHLIDRPSIQQNAGPNTKEVPEKVTGITINQQENWLGDRMDDYESYGPAAQPDKAAQLLEEAGYSKDGGTWKNSNGAPITLPYITPNGWSDWTTATQSVVDQLNSFGFDATINSTPAGEMFGNYANNNYTMGAMYWAPGGARAAFPYYSLSFQLNQPWTSPDPFYPDEEVTIPGIGGDGELTLNPHDRIAKIPTMTDEAELQSTIQELAWHANVELPVIQVLEKQNQSWLTDDEWTIPDPDGDAAQVQFPCYWSPRTGDLQAKTE